MWFDLLPIVNSIRFMRTFLFLLAIGVSSLAVWFTVSGRSAESVYLEMVELYAWKAEVIELPISPEIKQRDLIYVEDKLQQLNAKFESSQYTDAIRLSVLKRHQTKMEQSQDDIALAMKRASQGLK